MTWRLRSRGTPFFFPDLDEVTRKSMLAEWEAEERVAPFRGAELTARGRIAFPGAMRSAIVSGDEQSLLVDLANPDYWEPSGVRPDRYGRPQFYTINSGASARRLAITEFNTAYVHGVTRRLLDENVAEVEVYRAAPAFVPRGECLEHEGQRYPTQLIYAGHRARYHPVPRPRVLSVPLGPNCHHSVRRPR